MRLYGSRWDLGAGRVLKHTVDARIRNCVTVEQPSTDKPGPAVHHISDAETGGLGNLCCSQRLPGEDKRGHNLAPIVIGKEPYQLLRAHGCIHVTVLLAGLCRRQPIRSTGECNRGI